MGSAADFALRVRGYFADAGRGLGRALKRSYRDVAVSVEERPDIGPLELELPYPLPTRKDPLALGLFYFSAVTLVVTLTAVPATYKALGQVPLPMVATLGTLALILGVAGNLNVLGRLLEESSTPLLRPLVDAGVPLLNALHYWFGPAVAVLAVVYVVVHPSNNWLMHAAALALVAWMVTGLLLKLPRDSPWNGPALRRWAAILHRRPFVYVVVIALVFVSAVADLVY